MNKNPLIAAAFAVISLVLSACGGATPQAAAPVVDSAATKAAMAKEEAMKKEAMVVADATKDAMAKEEAMKKEAMVVADATKDAMAKEEAMKKEAMVEADATKEAMAKEEAMKQGAAMMLAKGEFTKVDASHFASGQASIDKTADGKLVLRFANFSAAAGPDLYVHLSANAAPRSADEVMSGGASLDLGVLQQGTGDQEYALPADFDAAKYNSVVIYCKQFSVVFSTATLSK